MIKKVDKEYITTLLFVIILSIFSNKACFAQTSNTDSLYFSTVFQTPVYQDAYSASGTWYLYPPFNSRKALFDSLDNLMKFGVSDYYGANNNIKVGNLTSVDSINNTMNYYYSLNPVWAYRQKDPVWELTFSLNGKKSATYCTFTPTINPDDASYSGKTAILFITGSGTNNGTEMVQGIGYQNIYGNQKDSLATLGDVYIAIRPLIDFRAFVWDNNGNLKALNSEFPHPNQIISYLNGRGTPYGLNSLIESIALVKYLKGKYQKVIIAGLSYGGIYTTLNAFESAPEGALISGGYSISIDEISDNDYQTASFGQLIFSLTRDSVKNNIQNSTTEFLFSWGRTGDIYLETQLHYTKNYFAGLNNIQYYYDYDLHTFPPFQAFKNLFDSINNRPTVRVRESEDQCSPSATKMMVTFSGKKPYKFDLYKDSVFYNSYKSLSDTFGIDINQEGIYKIKNLTDDDNNVGFNSDNYIFKPNNNIGITLSRQSWNCSPEITLKKVYRFTGGQGPWDIYYRENGIAKSKIYNTSNIVEFNWGDGIYIIDSINNYGNCMKYINDTTIVNSDFSQFADIFNTPSLNCNTDSILLSLKDYFVNATEIFFKYNGNTTSATIRDNKIALPNGNYEFIGIKTAGDCVLPLNFTNKSPKNPFDKGSVYLDNMQIKTGNTGVLYVWYFNGQPFNTTSTAQSNFIGNGLYDIKITNINGCVSRTDKIYFDKGKLFTYPNPFNNHFELFVELPQNKIAIVDIFDPTGRKLASTEIKNGTNSFNFGVYKKGVYILKLRYKEGGFNFDTLKIVKL